jgi:hypothetical protein
VNQFLFFYVFLFFCTSHSFYIKKFITAGRVFVYLDNEKNQDKNKYQLTLSEASSVCCSLFSVTKKKNIYIYIYLLTKERSKSI